MGKHKKKNRTKNDKGREKKKKEPSGSSGEIMDSVANKMSECEVIDLADVHEHVEKESEVTAESSENSKVIEEFSSPCEVIELDTDTQEPGKKKKKSSKHTKELLESDPAGNIHCAVIELNTSEKDSTVLPQKRPFSEEQPLDGSTDRREPDVSDMFRKKKRRKGSRNYRSHEVSETTEEAGEVTVLDTSTETSASAKVSKQREKHEDEKPSRKAHDDVVLIEESSGTNKQKKEAHHEHDSSPHSSHRDQDRRSDRRNSPSERRQKSSDCSERRPSPPRRDHRRWEEEPQRDRNSNNLGNWQSHHQSSDQQDIANRLFQGENCALLILQESEKLLIRGHVQVKCLYGQFNILGFNLTPSHPPHPIYSPDSSSAISVQASAPPQDSANKLQTKTLKKSLKNNGFVSSDISEIVKKVEDKTSVLLLTKLECHMCDFVSCVSPFQGLFDTKQGKKAKGNWFQVPELQVALQMSHRGGVNITYEQRDAIERIAAHLHKGGAPVVVLCGGKNVGKSTTARILLNSLLNHCSGVAYLECDLGQTEFTPPACLGLSLVTEPVFGPPFTHQREPVRQCFVGAVSPADNPGFYTRCVEFVFEKYASLNPRPPLVVNTMGWNKGLGLAFLADTLRLVQPDFVIQLNSQRYSHNMQPIDEQFLNETRGWKDMKNCQEQNRTSTHSHIHLPIASPVSDNSTINRYRPADHRDMALLAHLSSLTAVPSADLMALAPYRVPWNEVAVHVSHSTVPSTQLMYAINASVVALCQANDDQICLSEDDSVPGYFKNTPVCECLGLGIIRGIDPVEKVFLLLTPLDASKLSRVNCLLRGVLELPTSMVLKKESGDEDVPYVGESKDVTGATSIKRRRHMHRRRPSPHHP